MHNGLKIFVILLLFTGSVYGQHIQGDIAKDHRKMLTHPGDTIHGSIHAVYTIQFSVNAKGNVTSTEIIDEKTDERSSVARMKAMNLVRTFKFEPGVWFPKYHQGQVTIYMVDN